jgi:ATP phosphoribosyltransferase
LPDGHQQQPTIEFLNSAGIEIQGYSEGDRRPTIDLSDVSVKVVRPQDMPLQVANGNFDLAITGRDWLFEHMCQFPSSPVRELLDLGFGRVKLVAVVSKQMAVDSVEDLRRLLRGGTVSTLRVASEYVGIADRYAQDNHLGPYRVIPTWGATEAFLPEDADLLLENTQTGRTIARHNLKIINTLFESSACLIGNANGCGDKAKDERVASIVELLRSGRLKIENNQRH